MTGPGDEGTGRYKLPGEGPEGEHIGGATKESPIKTYEAGEWIFHAGEKADRFWLIKSGRVAQYKGETRISELGARRFLGMRTFMLEGWLETSAQATEPSEIVELDLAFLKNFLRKPEAVLAFLREQELELVRLAENNARFGVECAGQRQRIGVLEAELKRYGTAGEAKPSGIAESSLRLIQRDMRQADADLDALPTELPTGLWRALQENENFNRLFLTIKTVMEHLRSVEFTTRG